MNRRCGPHLIAFQLHLPQLTASKVQTRYRVPLLGHIDLNTGVRVRKAKPVRYERDNPGELVHVDVKKLGRIPDGGRHRRLAARCGTRGRNGRVPAVARDYRVGCANRSTNSKRS